MAQESDKTIVTKLLGRPAFVEYTGGNRWRGEVVSMWVDRDNNDVFFHVMLPGGKLVMGPSAIVRPACDVWSGADTICIYGRDHFGEHKKGRIDPTGLVLPKPTP